MQLPAAQVTVPCAGSAVAVTLAGLSDAPFGSTVSLPVTGVLTGVFGGVVAVSGLAVTTFGCTVTVTTALTQTGVGAEVSQTW